MTQNFTDGYCGRDLPLRSRREFLQKAGLGFGMIAATDLLAGENPLAARKPHFPAKADSVIFLFMHGGPSHIDTFDPKPLLNELHGQPVPESFGSVDLQFTKVDRVPLIGSPRAFRKRGDSGLEISDLFENVAAHADALTVVRSCHHDGFTHVTGQNWMNTGWARVGRPSIGSWVTYGLGSENENLPAYMVMLDGPIKAGPPAYGAGFLPAVYQGTVLRSQGPPILNIERPRRYHGTATAQIARPAAAEQRRALRRALRRQRVGGAHCVLRACLQNANGGSRVGGPFRRKRRRPASSTASITARRGNFGEQCLRARRMVERGVRFVQIYSGGRKGGAGVGWDGHNEIDRNHEQMARSVDRPIAGLLTDLKQRGMLDRTLVVWGGDFGRTPFTDGAEGGGSNRNGRDHNPYGFTVWMAGGGVRGGQVIGSTDAIGLRAQEDKVHMHDLHATILSLLGLDHEQLTYFFQGRDFRLTDVGGGNNLAGRIA